MREKCFEIVRLAYFLSTVICALLFKSRDRNNLNCQEIQLPPKAVSENFPEIEWRASCRTRYALGNFAQLAALLNEAI